MKKHKRLARLAILCVGGDFFPWTASSNERMIGTFIQRVRKEGAKLRKENAELRDEIKKLEDKLKLEDELNWRPFKT